MKNVIAFLLIFVSSFVFSQNNFNVTSQSVGVNTSFSLEIGLENTSEVLSKPISTENELLTPTDCEVTLKLF